MIINCFPDANLEIKVPSANCDNRKELIKFALSFNGYQWADGGPDKVGEIYKQVKEKIKEGKLGEISLEELRCCLFWRQRAHRWNGEDYGNEEYKYWIKLIREKLASL